MHTEQTAIFADIRSALHSKTNLWLSDRALVDMGRALVMYEESGILLEENERERFAKIINQARLEQISRIIPQGNSPGDSPEEGHPVHQPQRGHYAESEFRSAGLAFGLPGALEGGSDTGAVRDVLAGDESMDHGTGDGTEAGQPSRAGTEGAGVLAADREGQKFGPGPKPRRVSRWMSCGFGLVGFVLEEGRRGQVWVGLGLGVGREQDEQRVVDHGQLVRLSDLYDALCADMMTLHGVDSDNVG